MADQHPELQVKLAELDHELEEGDITKKGYEKRRTFLFDQYLGIGNGEQSTTTTFTSATSNVSPNGGRVPSFSQRSPHQAYKPYSPENATQYSHASLGPGGPGGYAGRPLTPASELGIPPMNSHRRQSSLGFSDTRPDSANSYSPSRTGTMMNSDYAFNPEKAGYNDQQGGYGSPDGNSRLSTMMDSQGYFSDFAGQQMQEPRDSYGGPNRYSSGNEAFSPSANIPPPLLSGQDIPQIQHQLPLEPREVPFAVFDPHNSNVQMSKFDNIGAVLRHRGRTNGKQPAYWVLDQKGKETASITWEKLTSRAEKVAQVIRDKSNLYRGDRVALVYRDTEIIDFAVALLGCFIAGVVAVPINDVDDYQKLSLLLTTTQAHLALTTDNNLKAFHRDINNHRLKWPAGVEWWKTNEFGSYHPKKKDEAAPLSVPDLAYIEFSRAPTGDLRGVVLSHRTIMHQMACISAIISTIPDKENNDTFNPALRGGNGQLMRPQRRSGEIILSYLDPREGCGLILGVLFGVYGGHTTVWLESKTVETPGLYAHLISKYSSTIMVADYPGLKRAAYNYQQDPMATRNYKKGTEPNFGSVKICLIDTLTVDCEFHEILADRWLRPMRNPRARELVAPMLCLPEHGGMIVSVRDWLGGEERMGCQLSAENEEEEEEDEKPSGNDTSNGYTSLIGGGTAKKNNQRKSRAGLSDVLLDKEALKTNEVNVLAVGEEAKKRANEPGVIRAGAFGFPIPDATLALVDPETHLLCSPYMIGEIWVDSPSLSGGFWALPKHTETIFHARPYRFMEGNPTPVTIEPEFLRTGLLGCIIEGKLFVLGLYEDRIRQRVEWVEHGVQELEHRYFFVQHLVSSIMKSVLKIYDCSAFDAHVNGEFLPIILVETQAASTAPTTAGGPPRQLDIPFLDSLAERCMEVLYQEHHLRVYCVMITAPNTLPRVVKNGRREIGNMLCRRDFDNGSLPCVHVKFGVERAVQNLPVGDDPAGGIWSMVSTQARQELLMMQDKQYSGVDHREVVIDDRTSTPLNQFSNIHDLLQWRVSRQSEELAYCSIDGRGKEGKPIPWKKFDLKVAGVAMYLKNKVKVQPGDHLLLMYTHSEDFAFAVHACFCLGAVAIPMAPLDANRLSEDAPAFLHMVADFRVKAVLVNNDVDSLLKQKTINQHLKQSALILRVNVPNTYNTSKPSKQHSGCRELGLTIRPGWVAKGNPVLIWTYWTPDQRRVAVQLGHDTIMALCKVQKETCQMTSTRPILGCVRSTMGLGFIHTCLMGIFLAAPTYLVSPVDFAGNPNLLFQTLARYKIKDTYATSQMLDHAMAQNAGKNVGLHELKNLMITTDSRPRVDVYQKVRVHFASAALDRTAINTIYSHVLNPMVASRSYMCIEPIELYLDMNALRRGLVIPVDPDQEPFSLLVQDSGMVPVSTQISIVNPETCRLCLVGEYGEIWVQSEANGYSFYGSKDAFDSERFNGRTVDGDPNVRYMRTGDLGFLHNVSRPIGPGGAPIEMQVLFILGSIGETFEVNGLCHFPMDIERTIEKSHRNIVPGGAAIFQAGGLVVVLVEIFRKNFLASIVPVIINSVLNEHHLVLDIVAFVSKGDFPRSRLGEKQRGKILASWVTRKMRTIAQFSIRDPDGADGTATEVAGPPGAAGTLRNGSVKTESVKTGSLMEPAGSIAGSLSQGLQGRTQSPPQIQTHAFGSIPPGISEIPTEDEPLTARLDSAAPGSDSTPTAERPQPPMSLNTTLDYSPIDMPHSPSAMSWTEGQQETLSQGQQTQATGQGYGDTLSPNDRLPQHQQYGQALPYEIPREQSQPQGQQPSHVNRFALDDDDDDDDDNDDVRYDRGASGGGLRVANRTSVDSEDWPQEALMHMNMGGQAR
ncbi:AMP-binding protein [Viridothelium virens]|uniref:AMP-binding protein n=1 Tax=Viridothelium virens TaxID=1048519 RepID=A0A6A6HJY7_VIRVR|nr:AMP-binding protein [Viridothelium virens]